MWKKILVSLFISSVVMISINQSAFAMRQPAMERSLQILQHAERVLMRPSADKGRHRAKALRHIRKAMKEIRKGIESANRRSEGGHYKQRKNMDNVEDRSIDKDKGWRMESREKEYTEQDDYEKEMKYLERRYEK